MIPPHARLLAACLAALACVPGAAAPELPAGSAAMAALASLAAAGVVARRDGAPLPASSSRAQAAGMLEAVLWEAARAAGAGAPGRPEPAYRAHASALRVLARELLPELTAGGVAPETLEAALRRVERYWSDGRPQGVNEPLVSALGPRDSARRAEGARGAAAAWERGELCLYVPAPLPETGAAYPAGLPVRALPAGEASPVELAAGHNEEVWRRLRRSGPPPAAGLPWLAWVFRPEQAWRGAGGRAARLSAARPESAAPDGQARARLELSAGAAAVRILLPRREHVLRLPPLCSCRSYVEIAWGPAGSGVLFLRSRVAHPDERPVRRYVLHLPSGALLNAEAARR